MNLGYAQGCFLKSILGFMFFIPSFIPTYLLLILNQLLQTHTHYIMQYIHIILCNTIHLFTQSSWVTTLRLVLLLQTLSTYTTTECFPTRGFIWSPVNSPKSSCFRASLNEQLSKSIFSSFDSDTGIQSASSPRLKNITAQWSSCRGPPQTYVVPSSSTDRLILEAWMPRGSWLMAMSSSLPKIDRVSLEISEREQPIRRGALSAHQRAKWAVYSSKVMPPLPTSSMSGSFQPPWPAQNSRPTCLSRIEVKDFQLSLMSPVVLQELAQGPAHCQDFSSPQLHMEQKMGRPLSLRALCMAKQRAFPLKFKLQQLSYLRQSTFHSAQVSASIFSQPQPPGLPSQVFSPASLQSPNLRPLACAQSARPDMPEGNLRGSERMRLVLGSRATCQQSSRLRYLQPLSASPVCTSKSAVFLMSVSLMLQPNLFQLFQPIWGVLPSPLSTPWATATTAASNISMSNIGIPINIIHQRQPA